MAIIRGKVINSREHKPNVKTDGTTPEKFKRMLDLAEAKEAERLAARAWTDIVFITVYPADAEAYYAARKRVDELTPANGNSSPK